MAKAAGYKLATYKSSDGPRAGLIVGDKVFDAAALTGKAAYASVLGILADWRTAEGCIAQSAAGLGKSRKRARQSAQKPAARQDQIAGAGAVSLGDLLRRLELCRPRRRDGGARRPAAAARSAHLRASKPGIFSKPRARSPIPARA